MALQETMVSGIGNDMRWLRTIDRKNYQKKRFNKTTWSVYITTWLLIWEGGKIVLCMSWVLRVPCVTFCVSHLGCLLTRDAIESRQHPVSASLVSLTCCSPSFSSFSPTTFSPRYFSFWMRKISTTLVIRGNICKNLHEFKEIISSRVQNTRYQIPASFCTEILGDIKSPWVFALKSCTTLNPRDF